MTKIIRAVSTPDFDKRSAQTMLMDLILNMEAYDISSFKECMNEIIDIADLRDIEDRTDFSFKERRNDD